MVDGPIFPFTYLDVVICIAGISEPRKHLLLLENLGEKSLKGFRLTAYDQGAFITGVAHHDSNILD